MVILADSHEKHRIYHTIAIDDGVFISADCGLQAWPKSQLELWARKAPYPVTEIPSADYRLCQRCQAKKGAPR